MFRRLAQCLTTWALAASAPLAAQDPPAHLASRPTDSAARFFLSQVRFLLAAADSIST